MMVFLLTLGQTTHEYPDVDRLDLNPLALDTNRRNSPTNTIPVVSEDKISYRNTINDDIYIYYVLNAYHVILHALDMLKINKS